MKIGEWYKIVVDVSPDTVITGKIVSLDDWGFDIASPPSDTVVGFTFAGLIHMEQIDLPVHYDTGTLMKANGTKLYLKLANGYWYNLRWSDYDDETVAEHERAGIMVSTSGQPWQDVL